MDKKYIVNSLNELLHDIYIDINTFEDYIKNSKNENVISQISKIRNDYQKHALRICKIITKLGGTPIQIDNFTIIYPYISNDTTIIDEELLKKTCAAANNVLNLGCKLISDPNFINRESYTTINLMNKDYQKHINHIERHELFSSSFQ
ncbi:ferritin-like domain-containing protein [Clostridium sp.]|uniref:ferritin-like domain-containing protein n=1 Tax=Clostridium sp. TaxID=1506 RepID=UPI00321679D6